jgi:hypothetical protein
MTVVEIYALGAVALAIWLDLRRPAPSLKRALIHVAAAMVVLQLLPPALRALEADDTASIRLPIVLLLVVLPAFVYGFFAFCRLLRVLAELAPSR